MRVKLILPALTEAKSPFFRPVKYALFPPLGLATLAGYLRAGRRGHARATSTSRRSTSTTIPTSSCCRPTSPRPAARTRSPTTTARRAPTWRWAGCTRPSLPEEAARHADSVFIGPGEDTWPRVPGRLPGRPPAAALRLARAHARRPAPRCGATCIKRHLYLVPNSLVVSRGCPHSCGFCYKDAFFAGGRGFYTQRVDRALAEIERCPGGTSTSSTTTSSATRASPRRSSTACAAWAALWQAAGTVASVLRPGTAREGARRGPAQPVRRLRDTARGAAARLAQGLEPRPRLRRGRAPAARARRDGQRQLRLRHGRRRRRTSSTARSSGRSRRGSRPRPSTCSRPTRARRCSASMEAEGRLLPPRLGPLRHAARGLRAARHDRRRSSRPATGAPTATSTAGVRSRARRRRSRRSPASCATPRTRRAGRSSSPPGTSLIRSGLLGRARPLLERVLDSAQQRASVDHDTPVAREYQHEHAVRDQPERDRPEQPHAIGLGAELA